MANGDQLNFEPHFQETSLPCEGEVGDLIVVTPLKDREPDPTAQGSASLWFCLKSGTTAERPAIWARVQFDGIATCRARVPTPPQNHPTLQPNG